MKKNALGLLAVIVCVLLGSCSSSPTSGVDVLGRWYESIDEAGEEIDSTSFVIFGDEQQFTRRYHNAGSLEVGGYACSADTKEDYGNHPSKRVTMSTGTGEVYYIDIVCPLTGKELRKFKKENPDAQVVWMWVFTFKDSNKEKITYFVKDPHYNADN